MKSKLTLFALFAFVVSGIYAQKFTYDDSWSKHGLSLNEAGSANVELTYSIKEFNLEDFDLKGEAMKNIKLPGNMLPNNEGAPNLPGNGRFIAIPEGAEATLEVLSARTEIIKNVEIAPAPRIPLDTEDGPLDYKKDQSIYSKNAFYPEEPFLLSDVQQVRGVDAVMLGITPFQYNPVTKELKVYRDVQVKVNFKGGNGQFGENRLRSRHFESILSDAFINHSSLPEIDFNKKIQNSTREAGCEYLIVSPNGAEFQQWADSIKRFRIQQGIPTKVVTLDEIGGSDVGTLEAYFNDAYNNWTMPPAAVLLLGDYGSNAENSVISPIYDNYCASDNIFADVDGDHMPDMVFARITARDASELEVMITKFLNYERTPPTDPDFYNHPITALGWQTTRWFQICSETVGGYFKNVHGKDPVRINAIYQGTPGSQWSTATNTQEVVDYFGPNGLGYIPASPSELGGWSGGTEQMVTDAINAGSFLLQHRDHGLETGWGEPYYRNSSINNLTNTDLTFIMSINCLTGKYNWSSESFTEKFHRYTESGNNSGALGLIAASEVSYSFVNDTYVWGMYDNMWPDFMPDYGTTPEERGLLPSFGNAAGKYFLQQSNWPYNTNNKQVTYHLFHHHGGAFLELYSEVPQNLELVYDDVILGGLDFFTIEATEGAFIALTVGDNIIGTGTGQGIGNPVDISIVPQQVGTNVRMTITKTNYYRHSSNLTVVSPDAPFCLYNTHDINDVNGNNNGLVDYGENILLEIGIENLGNVDCPDAIVRIQTSDQYVTLIDSEENYGSIPAHEIISIADAFEFDVDANIPDLHSITFEVIVEDENTDEIWNSQFSVVARTPDLVIADAVIIDSITGNGNGILDPGETATISIQNENDGHCPAYNSIGYLSTTSPYVTIGNESDSIGEIGFFFGKKAEFEVSIDPDIPAGIFQANFTYEVTSNDLTETKNFTKRLGIIVEDFESGDFTSFDWQMGGDEGFAITSYNWEGNKSAKSGFIQMGETSEISLPWEVMFADSISFMVKPSSHPDNKLKFYINNTLKGEWSGANEDWKKASFYVGTGNKTFKWVYDKQTDIIHGTDCVFLDWIVLPPVMTLTSFAGYDAQSCTGEDYQCQGEATDYASLEWSTSGTGTFNDNTIPDPVYTPSSDDFANGSVILTLTAMDDLGDTYDDNMTLVFIEAPEAPAIVEGPDWIDVLSTATSDYVAEESEIIDSYAWQILPEEAGTIEGTTNIGNVTWNADYLGIAMISVRGINECGEGEWSEDYEVMVDNTTAITEVSEGFNIKVWPNPSNGDVSLNLYSKESETIDITVYSTVGAKVFSLRNVKVEGKYNTRLELDDASEGLYFISIKGQDIMFNKKLIIRK